MRDCTMREIEGTLGDKRRHSSSPMIMATWWCRDPAEREGCTATALTTEAGGRLRINPTCDCCEELGVTFLLVH